MSFRMVPKSVILDDLERVWPLFYVILTNLVASGQTTSKWLKIQHTVWTKS